MEVRIFPSGQMPLYLKIYVTVIVNIIAWAIATDLGIVISAITYYKVMNAIT